jgi:hypothetical protein
MVPYSSPAGAYSTTDEGYRHVRSPYSTTSGPCSVMARPSCLLRRPYCHTKLSLSPGEMSLRVHEGHHTVRTEDHIRRWSHRSGRPMRSYRTLAAPYFLNASRNGSVAGIIRGDDGSIPFDGSCIPFDGRLHTHRLANAHAPVAHRTTTASRSYRANAASYCV